MDLEELKLRAMLAAKLLKVISTVDHVDKKGVNEKHKYSFVKAADLSREIRKAFVEHKVIALSDVVSEERWEKPTMSGGVMNYCDLTMQFTFIDAETGFAMPPIKAIGWGSDTTDKSPYKAATGCLKYALRTTFLVPDEAGDPEVEEDDDVPTIHVEPRTTPHIEEIETPFESLPVGHPNKRGPITEKQQKRLFAISQSAGWKIAELKSWLKANYKIESSADISKDDYERICTEIESGGAA